MIKAAILVLADVQTHADLGRVYNALVAAQAFKEAGDDVRIIFDGAATQWPGILSATDHPAHAAYDAVADKVTGACGYCARSFDADEAVHQAHVPMLEEYEGHPSIRRLLADGYQIISF